MSPIHYTLNYVADVKRSAALYARLLGAEPVELSANFAMFALPGSTALALWARDEVAPKATLPGGNELGFAVETDDAVRRTRDEWAALGLKIIQEPTRLDFGFTFTAADPDGHRLRVLSRARN